MSCIAFRKGDHEGAHRVCEGFGFRSLRCQGWRFSLEGDRGKHQLLSTPCITILKTLHLHSKNPKPQAKIPNPRSKMLNAKSKALNSNLLSDPQQYNLHRAKSCFRPQASVSSEPSALNPWITRRPQPRHPSYNFAQGVRKDVGFSFSFLPQQRALAMSRKGKLKS